MAKKVDLGPAVKPCQSSGVAIIHQRTTQSMWQDVANRDTLTQPAFPAWSQVLVLRQPPGRRRHPMGRSWSSGPHLARCLCASTLDASDGGGRCDARLTSHVISVTAYACRLWLVIAAKSSKNCVRTGSSTSLNNREARSCGYQTHNTIQNRGGSSIKACALPLLYTLRLAPPLAEDE